MFRITTPASAGQHSLVAARLCAAAAVGVLLVGTLAACGGAAGGSAASGSGAGQGSGTGSGQGSGQGFGRVPGANGIVADISGKTMQVQSRGPAGGGQVAVTWTARTGFTREVAGSLRDVKVGECVLVGSASGSTTAPTSLLATSVRLTPARNGSCDRFAGDRPGRPSGAPSAGPSAGPSGGPTGGPSGRPGDRAFGGAFGTVKTVSGKGFTISTPARGSTAAGTVTVSTTSGTQVSKQVTASAADLKVGECVAARGSTDQTGAVTARTVAISPPVDGSCGFGGPGRGSRSGGSGTGSA